MMEVKLGAAKMQRIEEFYEPNFDAKMFFPDWQPGVVLKTSKSNHKEAAPCRASVQVSRRGRT